MLKFSRFQQFERGVLKKRKVKKLITHTLEAKGRQSFKRRVNGTKGVLFKKLGKFSRSKWGLVSFEVK